MTVDIYSSTAQDPLSLPELQLYKEIMAYRAGLGLDPIPLSKALTATAGRHVLDTRENIWGEGLEPPAGANYHSWSDAPYPADGSNPEVMWFAPDRLGTGYTDYAYEITAVGYVKGAAALEGWKGSPGHDAILTNSGIWADLSFNAIGIGLETAAGPGPYGGRVFHVWFGEERDAEVPRIRGTGGDDRIVGTRFADDLYGRGGDDTVQGGRGNDTIRGSGGDDRLYGGLGHDVLVGGKGNDELNGGAGNDRISGGPGDDMLSGGSGGDTFVFGTSSLGDRDRILDVEPGVDRIDLSGFDADEIEDGNQAFRFLGPAGLDGDPGALAYRGGTISGDTNGDGRADFRIVVDEDKHLTDHDFLL